MDEKIIMFMLAQLISTVAIIIANKTDISWVKQTLEQHHERITKLEEK
ncbi:MAG: hypothetical protein ACPG8A_06945 [Psychrobium sp.]